MQLPFPLCGLFVPPSATHCGRRMCMLSQVQVAGPDQGHLLQRDRPREELLREKLLAVVLQPRGGSHPEHAGVPHPSLSPSRFCNESLPQTPGADPSTRGSGVRHPLPNTYERL